MELVGHVTKDLLAEEDHSMVDQPLPERHRLNEGGGDERPDAVVDLVGRAVDHEGGVGTEEDYGAVKELGKDGSRRPHCHHCVHLWPHFDQLLHLDWPYSVQGNVSEVPGYRVVEELPEVRIKQAWLLHHHLAQLNHPCINVRWQQNLGEVLVFNPHRGEEDGGDLVAIGQELLHDGGEEDEMALGPQVVEDQDMVAVAQFDQLSSQFGISQKGKYHHYQMQS